MELTFRPQGRELVALVDCRQGRTQLDSGKVGWYQVREVQWLRGWKLRAQVSVTRNPLAIPLHADEHGRRQLASEEINERPDARKYPMAQGKFQLIVEEDVVEMVFTIPDFMHQMQNSFGCSDGGRVMLCGDFQVQALVFAKTSDHRSELRRSGQTLEFIRTLNGRPTVLTTLADQVDREAGIREVLEKLRRGLPLVRSS